MGCSTGWIVGRMHGRHWPTTWWRRSFFAWLTGPLGEGCRPPLCSHHPLRWAGRGSAGVHCGAALCCTASSMPLDSRLFILGRGLLAMSIASLQACSNDPSLDVKPAIVTGSAHCLELADDGKVWSWGANHRGQLGVSTDLLVSEVPRQVQGFPKAAQVGAGNAHGVVLTTDGRVFAFGDNRHGQLGTAQPSFTSVPQAVPVPKPVVAIAVGGAHALAMTSNGDVWGWGSNQSQQLAQANQGIAWVPVLLPSVANARAIAADGPLSAIVSHDGQLSIFGNARINERCCWPTAQRVSIEGGSTVIVVGAEDEVLTRVQDGVQLDRRICAADRHRQRAKGDLSERLR